MRSLLCFPVLLLLFAACAGATYVERVGGTDTELPAVVAVLPCAGSELPDAAQRTLRIGIGNVFEQRGFAKLDDGWVDQRLALAGMQPWTNDWLQVDEFMNVFALQNRIDGLVFLEGFRYSDLTTGVYNARSLQGRCRILDTRKGQSTWIFDIGADEVGGLLLQSGQVLDALTSTIGDGERAEVERLSGLLALAVAEQLPRNANPLPVNARPVVDAVQAAADATHRTITADVRGTPGCRAFVSMPGCLSRYPLSEVEPGRYRGTLPQVRPSARMFAVLRDRLGATSRPHEASIAGAAQ